MTRPTPPERRLEETFHLKRGWLLVRVWRWPVILVFASIMWPLCATSATAQLSIVVMEKNRRRVALPTTDVTRIVGSTRRAPEPITVIPLSLEEGDELLGNTDLVAVKVRCNIAEYSLSGKFRVRMLPSSPRECNLYFHGSAGARLAARANGPTRVVSGAFTLGTTRTSYEIAILEPKKRRFLDLLFSRFKAIPIEAKVYEGEATVNSPSFSGVVSEGQKLALDVPRPDAIRRIEPDDYARSADVLARLDVSQIQGDTVELSAIFLRGDKSTAEFAALATNVERRALAGEDFCALAREFSQPPASAEGRCKIGIFALAALPPEVANTVKSMPAGTISKPVPTAEGYQILKVDARRPMTDDQLNTAYLELLKLHRVVLENPHNPADQAALSQTQQQLGIAQAYSDGVTLKPNEKRVVSFSPANNICRSPVTVTLTLNNASFIRLVSAPDVIISPGGWGEWQLEFDASGLKPGTYATGVELSCVDCANKQCNFPRQPMRVTMIVM